MHVRGVGGDRDGDISVFNKVSGNPFGAEGFCKTRWMGKELQDFYFLARFRVLSSLGKKRDAFQKQDSESQDSACKNKRSSSV